MGRIIEFPNPNRNRTMYPTRGALALAPQVADDCPAEIRRESPQQEHSVEVIPFPGAWDDPEETKAVPHRSFVCILKTRIVCPREFSETFSRAYVDAPIPLSTDVYRLAARSPPNMVACDAVNPYNYIARQYDPQTDLYFLRARYYSARNGRFLTQDPFLGFPFAPQTLHRYTYAYNNPLRYYDLTGYFATQAVSSLAGLFRVDAKEERVAGTPAGSSNNAGLNDVRDAHSQARQTFASGRANARPIIGPDGEMIPPENFTPPKKGTPEYEAYVSGDLYPTFLQPGDFLGIVKAAVGLLKVGYVAAKAAINVTVGQVEKATMKVVGQLSKEGDDAIRASANAIRNPEKLTNKGLEEVLKKDPTNPHLRSNIMLELKKRFREGDEEARKIFEKFTPQGSGQ